MAMSYPGFALGVIMLAGAIMPVRAQNTEIDHKVATITDSLLILCLAGGSQTNLSTAGYLDLKTRVKDILTGNFGVHVDGRTQFTREVWAGIIGGLSKDMTAIQGQQATEARKCMEDKGFALISKVLEGQ
jgi:hypothetical protein